MLRHESPLILRLRLRHVQSALLGLLATVLGFAPLVLISGNVSAAQLTLRSVGISSAVTSATGVTYTYGFTTATTSTIQSMQFQACTTALGTCTAPTGLQINSASTTEATHTGWTSGTAFARDGTGGGGCTPANNVLCSKRTSGTSETAGARVTGWDNVTNPSGASCASSNPNCTFFVRITIYSDTAWATPTDTGTVASSTTQSLTVNAAVQEILSFCVGSTTVDDATSSPGSDCSAISGTSLNLGVLDTSTVSTSPVTSNGGDSKNGIAMLRTNAVNGTVVQYKAIQQSGTNHQGTLRVSGASCNAGNVATDQCIDAASTTQTAFTAGTEKFGMTIAGVNCGSSTSYGCTFATGVYNLARDGQYDGLGSNTYGSSNAQGFAWDESGSFDTIADSSSSTIKVVDDEALIMRFAATPSITTPTGSYTAQGDFVATSTY